MRRAPRLALAVAALALAALTGACSLKGTMRPNLPPETTLFVQGPVDTVNHIVHLYWFGSDPDGDITSYEIRFFNPAAPAETAWVVTTGTDSLFTMYTGPNTTIEPRFEVRAVDDHGQRDPSPAVEDFKFSNQPPSLQFTIAPGLTEQTFYSLTLTWNPIDPDGDTAKMRYRVWLNGNAANARLISGNSFTIPSVDFTQGDSLGAPTDTIVSRIVYVQPIDDGGLAGPTAKAQWLVRKPVRGTDARLLVIDDVPAAWPGGAALDAFYTNAVFANLPAGTYSFLRLQNHRTFYSSADVEQTFKLFKAVIWYRGTQEGVFSTVPLGNLRLIPSYVDGISAYLESGGKLFVEARDAVAGTNANGLFPASYLERHLGSSDLYRYFTPTLNDSTVSVGIPNLTVLRTTSPFVDSLRFSGVYSSARVFALRDTSNTVFAADPGQLDVNNPTRVPLVISVPQTGGGRFTLVPFPMRGADGFGSAGRVLGRLLAQFGVTGP